MGAVLKFPENRVAWTERLGKAADHERETAEAHRLALDARNALVHAAVDDGYPQAHIATAMKCARATITRILAVPPKAA